MIQAHKFTQTDKDKVDILRGLTPNKYLNNVYLNGGWGLDNLKKLGVILLMGWSYDFKPYLKTFVYKQYGSWHECKAPNKTLLRKVIYGKIDKIVEVVD